MKLIILGSGTCVPSLTRSAPAYYLEGEGRQILIDCGSGTALQLERAGKSYKDIDAVFITHTHPDHIAGLVPIIHALVATPFFSREKELTIAGPNGFTLFFEKYISSVFGKTKIPFIQVIEVSEKMDFPPFHTFTAPTVHTENSIAYRFEYKGQSIVITGDAGFDDEIIELSRGTSLLVADCSFPESMKSFGHMTPGECGLLAKSAGAGKLVLSHLHALPVTDSDKLRECKEVFDGDVVLAEDLMEFDFP
jgi:ribonuclease BN (tRNA processing enzyme)